MNCKIIRRRWKLLPANARASNCCQNYHQGSILGQDNLLWLNQSTFVKSARKGVQNVPSEKKHIGNWSLTRVPNPWHKYVDSKHCWERFSEIGTNTCRFYIQIYTHFTDKYQKLKELEVLRTFGGEMLKESWQSKNQWWTKLASHFFQSPYYVYWKPIPVV